MPNSFAMSRAWLIAVLFCGLALLAALPAYTAPREYLISAAPQWVLPVTYPAQGTVPPERVGEGVLYLLSDQQVRLGPQAKSSYRHYATRAMNASGLDGVANIKIGFDPAYQTLVLHSINVIRDKQVIGKLDNATINILQRETELEYQMYDGSKTANIFLKDIRVGDIVEYAFSVNGDNPVFGGKVFGGFDLQWTAPVQRLHARLLVPSGREISLKARNTDLTPQVREIGDFREYLWDRKDVAALLVDKNAPGWFDPYPMVQWGEFKDWASVVQWALPLYRLPAQLSPALQAEVDKIAAAHPDVAGRMMAVLRFVQGEIRYLGVEVGAGSHAPSSPLQVLERRFGDCKDKTMLTIAMLDALGIKARPALVNTQARRGAALPAGSHRRGLSTMSWWRYARRMARTTGWIRPALPSTAIWLASTNPTLVWPCCWSRDRAICCPCTLAVSCRTSGRSLPCSMPRPDPISRWATPSRPRCRAAVRKSCAMNWLRRTAMNCKRTT
ncbi:DUF3857 domain-containing transglutaminase family protein [Chitinimonas arctica]|nr:DUF3857 domain-containing transglutaminase family protein [Chitinimonas arctica]